MSGKKYARTFDLSGIKRISKYAIIGIFAEKPRKNKVCKMLFEDRLNKKSKTKIYKKIIKKAAQGLTYALIKKEGIKSQASTEGKT